jgi:hypothetical protein
MKVCNIILWTDGQPEGRKQYSGGNEVPCALFFKGWSTLQLWTKLPKQTAVALPTANCPSWGQSAQSSHLESVDTVRFLTEVTPLDTHSACCRPFLVLGYPALAQLVKDPSAGQQHFMTASIWSLSSACTASVSSDRILLAAEDFNTCKLHIKIQFIPHKEQILSPL